MILVALAGCATDLDLEPELDESEQAATSPALRNPIDAPRGRQGVADLRTSQLVRLPASWFLDASVDVSGTHGMAVRTRCVDGIQASRRDTGLVVVRSRWTLLGWEHLAARYNDDVGTGTCPTCSRVDLGTVTGSYRYSVYAFSNRRTTASCFVEYARDTAAASWTPIAPPGHSLSLPLHLGGALVEIGAVDRALEWFEVKTADEGGVGPDSRSDTKMLVFDIGATAVQDTAQHSPRYAPVLARDISATDRDARVAGLGYAPMQLGLCGTQTPCSEPKHFALVGLERRPQPSLGTAIGDVETTVSLVRGPEDLAARRGRVGDQAAQLIVRAGQTAQCGQPLSLGVGRYSAAVRGVSRAEYGEDRGIRGDASWMIRNWGYPTYSWCWGPNGTLTMCPDPLRTPDADLRSYYYRGTPNFRAFTMRVEGRAPGGVWTNITAARQVPNGAFGCVDNGCLDTFLEDFELYRPSEVRTCIDNADSRIAFEGYWAARRNTPSAEIKIASHNTHHGDQGALDSGGIENDAESRNLANLLATRGRFVGSTRGVLEEATDAPFEWNADVIALQENSALNSYISFVSEAERQSALDWRYVWGHGKVHSSSGYTAKNAVLAHALLTPPSTLLPPRTQRCWAEFDPTLPQSDGMAQCKHENNSGQALEVDYETSSVPATISVRRWGTGSDVPVLVLSVMMQPGGSNPKFHARRDELASLVTALKQYVIERPEVVGANPSSRDPRDADIRIVLAGDFNFYPHTIGENRWFVRELRRAFGYAVDTAAAHRDSHANFYDMHAWRGMPNAAWPHHPEGDNGMPLAYTSGSTWGGLDSASTWWWGSSTLSWPHYFPYWAGTYRGDSDDYDTSGSHDRHDAVILVGKGWAKDDAVRSYVVMNTTAEHDEYTNGSDGQRGSPFAVRDAQGRVVAVDIAPSQIVRYDALNRPIWSPDRDAPNAGSDGRLHYQPMYPLTNGPDGCAQPGCAAVESDHIPVGVRLRISSMISE
jgi:hypothetical protein